ncbi:MAG TPA: universal stress protein [Longimicrobiales bacterium]
MYRSVFLPLDGSRFSEQALPLALSLVKRDGAKLEVVHVHHAASDDEWVPVTPFHYEGLERSEREWNGSDLQRENAYLCNCLENGHVDTTGVTLCKVLEGDVVPALEKEIAETDPDLIIMATHGRGGVSRAWLGSTADTLVRDVHKPILLIRATEEDEPVDLRTDHILVPLDGSRLGEAVVKHALELADPGRTRITLLRVVQPAYVGPEFTINVQGDTLLDERVEGAHEYLKELATQLTAEGFVIETDVVVSSSAAGAILAYATAHDADIICMATHGRTGVKRWLLGSVADKVMRGASTPLLLYRP